MRTSTLFLAALAALAAAAAACGTDEPVEPTFEAVVEQVIVPRCTFGSCHAKPTNAAQLDLSPATLCDALINQPSCLFPDRMLVVPGRPDDSFFFHKLTGQGLHEAPKAACANASPTNFLMPYGARALGDADLALVHGWIAAGAECMGSGTTTPVGPQIASLTATRGAPLVGESIKITVTLDRAAPEDLKIRIAAETGSLSAPVLVTVPAGKTAAEFDALAERPAARFKLRATAGESSKEIMLRIGGVEIAEVLANPPGPDDRLQWIKLRNRGARAVDLSTYQLRAGQSNYGLIAVDLAGTLEPGQCMVIGGPVASGANHEPLFAQGLAVDFSPDLPWAGTQAAGFALFDRNAAPVDGVETPVDTMLVGAHNQARLVGPDAEIASPYCATPAEDTSAQRTGLASCVQAAPLPRTCL
jgi:hypothetical protein